MALAATIEKTRKDIERTLADTGALNAVVGAGDLAVKKLRDARADLTPRVAAEQVMALPSKAQAVFDEAVTTALTAYGELAGRGKNLVTRVRRQQATVDLKDQTSATASHAKATVTTAKKSADATKTAAKSARTTARKSASATKTATKSAKTAARNSATEATPAAKAARTTAKKSAARTQAATKSAATTAKKSAARTATSVKSTTTSARKTATAAKKAVEATASKVGN